MQLPELGIGVVRVDGLDLDRILDPGRVQHLVRRSDDCRPGGQACAVACTPSGPA